MLLNIGRTKKRASEVSPLVGATLRPAEEPERKSGGAALAGTALRRARVRLPPPEPVLLPVIEELPRGARGGREEFGVVVDARFFRAAEVAWEDRERESRQLQRMRAFAPIWMVNFSSFYFMSAEEIRDKFGVVECKVPNLEGPQTVNSPAMGTLDPERPCRTCNLPSFKCTGHRGYINLAVPLPNPLTMHAISLVLQSVCPNCGSVLVPLADRNDPQILSRRGPDRLKKIAERVESSRNVVCPRNLELASARLRASGGGNLSRINSQLADIRKCVDRARETPGATDPTIAAAIARSGRAGDTSRLFGAEFGECPRVRVKYSVPKASSLDWKITRTISTAKGVSITQPVPIEHIQCIFNSISEPDLRFLGFSGKSHPKNFILQAFPVIPERYRAPAERDGEKKPDHLTIGYLQIIRSNITVANLLEARARAATDAKRASNETDLSKAIEHLYMLISRFMDNRDGEFKVHKDDPAMTIAARLSGKEGLSRALAQGKRTNNCGRSVAGCAVTPFGTVMIPGAMRALTLPERVNIYNLSAIRRKAEAGDIISITSSSGPFMGMRMTYRYLAAKARERDLPPPEIKVGDLVYRRAETGDDVIINRQPSLHRHSFIGASAIFQPWQCTVKIPLHYTVGLNADFDGDEINVSEPQTNRAIAEVRHLMHASKQIISSAASMPIMGLVFNCPTAAYVLSRDHDDLVREAGGDGRRARAIFTQEEVENVINRLLLDRSRADTLPARLRAAGIPELTPRALFSLVLPDTFFYSRRYQTSEPVRDPATGEMVLETSGDNVGLPKMREVAGRVLIKRGVFISGLMDKKDVTVGIIQELHQRYGASVTSRFLMEGDFLLNWYFERRGFSIGLKDCLLADPASALQAVNTKIRAIRLKIAERESEPPMTETEVLFREAEKVSLLQSVGTVGERLISSEITGSHNPLGTMISSGAKGSTNNLAMIVGCLGEQFISGKFPRAILYGRRTSPYFEVNDTSIEAHGFVRESFGSGLRPASFFYHMAASRIGLLDTAISTSVVGDLSRKVSRILENDKIGPYGEVVSSIGSFTSQSYGEGFSLTELVLVTGFASTGDVYMPFDLNKLAMFLNEEDED